MPDLDTLKPFLVLGLALGGVFAMSGVGLVVLYRATGVLNLAYGAIGAMGALISWSMIDAGINEWVAYLACIAFGGGATLVYGLIFGPPFAPRDPLVKATATLGFLLILVGLMQYVYGRDPHSITLPTSKWNYDLGDFFEIGTVFTVIAGLLNILAIYDAYGGPLIIIPNDKKKQLATAQ